MTIEKLLSKVELCGIKLYISNNELRYRALKGHIKPEQKAYLKSNKAKIYNFLKNQPTNETPHMTHNTPSCVPPGHIHPGAGGPDNIRALRGRYEALCEEREELWEFLDDKSIPFEAREEHLEHFRQVIWNCEVHRIELEKWAERGTTDPIITASAEDHPGEVDLKIQEERESARQWNEITREKNAKKGGSK